MEDEPSIPMDQEEEDNDEYYSARESKDSPAKKKESQEKSEKSSTPTPQKSDRSDSEGSSEVSNEKSPDRQQAFFSDEHGHTGMENSTKKSEKVRRMLKDRNRWDMREYKKEELEAPKKNKKKKKKKKGSKAKKVAQVEQTEEKSKTDDESDEDQTREPGQTTETDTSTSQARSFFQSEELILKSEKPIAPKCTFNVLRFAKTQDVVEYDSEGMQHQLGHYNERAISNPWRRWGAHRALCDQGGFQVDKKKKIVEIKRGSDPPPCPPNPRQITLNKNNEAPDSQTMMGTLKVEPGPAEEEVHRLGKVMEDYVKKGGFVPPPMNKKEMAAKPVKAGQPQVVVQVKAAAKPKNVAPKPKKTGAAVESDDCQTEDESVAEKAKKMGKDAVQAGKEAFQQAREDSRKRGGAFSFFKRKKASGKGKNTKGSIR